MCATCDWALTSNRISDFLGKRRLSWAKPTLYRIREWILVNRHVTDEQKVAISNIEAKGRPKQ